MSQIPARSRLAAALALLMILSAAATGRADTHRVVVRVYDTGVDDPALRSAAIHTASTIVRQAGIDVEWHDCTVEGRRSACQDSRRAGNLIARFMPTFVPGTALRRKPIETLKSIGDAEPPLGFAVVDPDTRAGKMATVFHDQVDAVARRTGVDRSELLGRALAHEIGHLLLGTPGHSRIGIMRAMWTDEELTRDRPEDWAFSAADSHQLQQNLIDAGAYDLPK
jgi:hypothetical protein